MFGRFSTAPMLAMISWIPLLARPKVDFRGTPLNEATAAPAQKPTRVSRIRPDVSARVSLMNGLGIENDDTCNKF